MAFDPDPDRGPGADSGPGSDSDPGSGLGPEERARLDAIRSADSLADLAALTGVESEHDAYFQAKAEWRDLRERELGPVPDSDADGLPGSRVVVGDTTVHVHGITHANTDAERNFLREHVSTVLDDGAAVYCEQGIRRMYFSEFPDVCAMDDYRWAMQRCEDLDVDSHLEDAPVSGPEFDGLVEEVDSLATQFRDAAFSLIESGGEVYGEEYARALGDVASNFLTSHEDLATGTDFRSFRLSREASLDPGTLVDLQRYYETAFLPQPLEREWLRRHDRELELVTHARNERMADYVVALAEEEQVHVIVGAAHQPGVVYYLDEHREGRRSVEDFEYVA